MFTIKSGAYARRVSTVGQVLAILNGYMDPIPDRTHVEVHGLDAYARLLLSKAEEASKASLSAEVTP